MGLKINEVQEGGAKNEVEGGAILVARRIMSSHQRGEIESADGLTDSESEFLSSPPRVGPRLGGKMVGALSGWRRKFHVFDPEVNADEYRVYRWRWFMLATLCLLNVSNGMVCLPPI